nr:trans-1,2-dihydrobenzene-1,2-diol dehydrogenase-like [Lytechinus pictus]
MSASALEANLDDLGTTDINPDEDVTIKNIDLSVVLEGPAPLRWGICATGLIAHDFVASLVGHERQHEVVAVASRSADRARKFADEFKIEKAYGSYEDLAKDTGVDIVYVASINTKHLEHCLLFIEHKKHVLCEKPIALTVRDTQEILKSAKQNGVFFMEGMWTAFFPACEKIREIITSGQLGDVRAVLANHGQNISHVERISKKDLGGGGLYDLGGYLIYWAAMVFGRAPLSLYTHGFLNSDGVDETSTTTMLYLGGAIATLTCSTKANYQNDVTIIGTKGRIRIPNNMWRPSSFEWINEEEESTFFEFTHPISDQSYHFGSEWSAMYFEAEAVRQAIARGLKEHPLMSWKSTQLMARLLEHARRDLRMTWNDDDCL